MKGRIGGAFYFHRSVFLDFSTGEAVRPAEKRVEQKTQVEQMEEQPLVVEDEQQVEVKFFVAEVWEKLMQ